MNYSTNSAKYLALDFQTSGLGPECVILEAAFVLLDCYFEPTQAVQSALVEPAQGQYEDVAVRLHLESGLLAELRSVAQRVTPTTLEQALLVAVQSVRGPTLIGRNPDFLQRFIRRWMPALDERLAGRAFDVGTLRQVTATALEVENSYSVASRHARRAAPSLDACITDLGNYFNVVRAGVRSPKVDVPRLVRLQALGGAR